jgi:hypothetical protein
MVRRFGDFDTIWTMQTTSHVVLPKPVRRARLGFAFAAIAGLYFFGLAASVAIPFGPSLSIVAAVRQVVGFNWPAGDVEQPLRATWLLHGVVVGAAAMLLAAYATSRSRQVRIAVGLVCLFAPLAATPGDGFKGVAQWLCAIPAAPILTIGALVGNGDGEFYAEGFLVYAAVGWWMILWSVLLVRERVRVGSSAIVSGNHGGACAK